MAETVLPQSVGYGVVIGICLFFSAIMLLLSFIQARYTGFSLKDSEEFSTASRSVKPGLIASGIVSAWTWAATLLQSSAVAYKYGISGPWWYGAGATIQILLFSQLAVRLKLNAPYAHTWLEIIKARWGTFAHLVFLFFGLSTNLIVSSMLVRGGSDTVTNLTGMNTIAACFIMPLGLLIYVIVGGMRSTLLCDYMHTTALFAIIFVFVFTVYATSDQIGSSAKMYSLLQNVSTETPVPGNAQGSYLTMRSKNGLIFGVINIIGNFATVFQDQAYWQRAIASRPSTTAKAYILGGIAWFAIPFSFATTLGLAAVALKGTPGMATLTPADVSKGLPAAAAASALLGKSGATALLVILFLAVTSATSAELIAVSSILTYDIYLGYINREASEGQILFVERATVALFAICMGFSGLIFFYIGIPMGWLYTFMGVILGSAVVPITLAITWSKANKNGCILGSIVGFFAGIIAWLVTTSKRNDGVINRVTSGGDYEMLAGNLASIGVGAILAMFSSYFWPENFDFVQTRAINAPSPYVSHSEEHADEASHDVSDAASPEVDELDPVQLKKSFAFAAWSSITLLVFMILIIPLSLFFTRTVFSVNGLTVWVVIGIIWTFFSAFSVIIYPIYESRIALAQICKGVVKDIFYLVGVRHDVAPEFGSASPGEGSSPMLEFHHHP